MSKLVISLKDSSSISLQQQLHQASLLADLIELRLDLIEEDKMSILMPLVQTIKTPVIWTLRTAQQGGSFKESTSHYLKRLHEILSWEPAIVDIEYWIDNNDYQTLQTRSPNTRIIRSCHEKLDDNQTMETLYEKLTQMPAHFYKLAIETKTVTTSLMLLNFAKLKNQFNENLCVIGVGQAGECTRILSPLVSCPFTFASLSEHAQTAPGQLTALELIHTYHYKSLNHQTKLYGLIGHPIIYSLSHVTHNAVFQALGENAVYVKFDLKNDSLSIFLEQFKQLNGCGLSITMPFKEQIIPLLSQPFNYLACNTISLKNDQWVGTNTDGIGAINALGIQVANEKILIIGAGGTAKAIAQEAIEQGATIAVINRTVEKAQKLANELSCLWGELKDFKSFQEKGFLIVIQTTPVGMGDSYLETPIPCDQIQPSSHVLDAITYPKKTKFLKEAKLLGCRTVLGKELFIQQAIAQFRFWNPHLENYVVIENILREHIDDLAVVVNRSKLKGQVELPASKSHSIRAILLAALANGKSEITDLLTESPDIQAAIVAAKQIGADVHYQGNTLVINGTNGSPIIHEKIIDAGNSGQILRFAAALAAISPTQTIFTGDQSIRSNRKVSALIHGLKQLGADAMSIKQDEFAPFYVKGPIHPGEVTMDGTDSQPVSALLMAAAFLNGETTIYVENGGEKPWLQVTLSWLDRLNVVYTHNRELSTFKILGNSQRDPFQLAIPGDWSSAAFLIVAALITQSTLTIGHADFNDVQGDKAILDLMQQLGANMVQDLERKELTILPSSQLKGGTIDVNDFIDAVPILAVLGCFLKEDLILTNASIARFKESNRLECMTTELTKMGAIITETEDGLIISPSLLKGAVVQSYHDHRVALALIVAGLGANGETVVKNCGCIRKSYPNFVQQIQLIGARIAEKIF